RRQAFNPALTRLRDVLLLIISSTAGPAIGAALAVLTFRLSPEGAGRDMIDVWWHWWVGHSVSILAITPAALSNWSSPRRAQTWQRNIELLVAYSLLIVTGFLIFVRLPFGNIPLGHVVFPFLVWLAIRFGPREVTFGGFLIMIIAVIGTLHGTGPFSRPSLNLNLLLLVTFIMSIVVTALVISAIIAQWRTSRNELVHSNELLESRVAERTQALTGVNADLQAEIDERMRVEHALLTARDQALAALEAKTQLLAHVSHDARTPLNVISLYTEILQMGRYGELNEAQLKALQTIRNNVTELEEFVENLLGQARLSTQTATVEYQDIPLQSCLQETVAPLLPLLERKNLAYRLEIDPAMPPVICSDKKALKHVLTNLMSNAIKFTNSGYVQLEANRQGEWHWQLIVSDSGIGMSARELEHVFEPFWQVDSSNTRDAHRGVGLGLAIVQQNSELLGGVIRVNSTPGKGSRFTITFPLDASLRSA
ncbi:MAG: MASE1 domain-containing protein, partial [Anaerolineales bacterium]|nr:MASE1 domain-containing protein [Anaerolineales bacterium]